MNRFSYLKFLFFYFLTCCFISCQKEYSFEGGLQAQYILAGSPAVCIPATLSGFYIEGKNTDSSNTLQVTVDVTLAGNYSIATIAADGISFIASGNFADTGIQEVTMQATGTPAAAGSFTVKIPGDNGCFVMLDVRKKAPSSYTLAGNAGDCSSPVITGTLIAGKALTLSDNVALQVNITVPGTFNITTDTISGISFSASGIFSTTGLQIVTLSGNGTPESTGLFFFRVQADSSLCGFSIPVQDAAPNATYVLQSGVQNSMLFCTPASVQGSYTAGTPLNISNSITVSAFATVTGNYTISTAKINGIIFSGRGTFNNMGAFDVVLMGSGTPLTVGNFIFEPHIIGPTPIGGETCGISIEFK